jgi:predicted ChrR family anti-sigma factor
MGTQVMGNLSLLWRDLLRLDPNDPHLAWQPFREGVEIVPLHTVPGRGVCCALLRYAAGAAVPSHTHTGLEYLIVLRGEQGDERGRYGEGALCINEPGTSHQVSSEAGCVVLAIWEAPVRFD